MSQRQRLFLLVPALVVAASLALTPPAQGDAASALADAVKQGEVLWKKQWSAGQKACVDCHASGQNIMKATRLKSYPKWDKALNRVVTAQQKLNQMLTEKSKGAALELGSADLNALEAYISTLK